MNPPAELIPIRRNALLIAMIAFGLLAIAFWLTPSSKGLGTHHDLGLPQCGWIVAANLPCPTCGMTTAWSHTVRGEFISAFLAQPMGLFLAVATMLVAVGGLMQALTGYSFDWLLYQFAPSRVFIVIGILTLASWGLKILIHRDLI